MNVFITVDVEIWCDGWNNLDKKFPEAFRKYIYGPTKHGNCGLPLKLKILQDHGLKAIFFVEPLFATRFGLEPLQEIVGLIKEYNQEIQLHLHTEWVDEAKEALLPNVTHKRQHLKQYSLDEQTALIQKGIQLLKDSGCSKVNAFRAGSFGANMDTLTALRNSDIKFDSSYNYTYLKTTCEMDVGQPLNQPFEFDKIYEYPISFFGNPRGKTRHAQLGACSAAELIYALEQANNLNWNSFVILSHNFELLSTCKTKLDKCVLKRFMKLCSFFKKNTDHFSTQAFNQLDPVPNNKQAETIKQDLFHLAIRNLEQIGRKLKYN